MTVARGSASPRRLLALNGTYKNPTIKKVL
jgi:hypothetical protein